MNFLKRIRKTEKLYKDVQDQFWLLQERIYKLEHLPKFKVGDKFKGILPWDGKNSKLLIVGRDFNKEYYTWEYSLFNGKGVYTYREKEVIEMKKKKREQPHGPGLF